MPAPRPRKISEFKPTFSNLAQTSHYQLTFGGLSFPLRQHLAIRGVDSRFIGETAGLLSSTAQIPGSSLGTADIAGNFMGVAEKMAHTRIFTQIDLEFYVDKDYKTMKFLEHWTEFIASGSGESNGSKGYYFRMQYPDDYKCEMVITKFNKDLKSSIREIGFADGRTSGRDQISYRFFRAWPYSLASTPVSYQGMNMLRCNITFRYDRYVVSEVTYPKQPLAGDTIRNITEFDNRPLPTRQSADSRPTVPSTTAPQRIPVEPRSEQGNSDPETTGGQTIDTNAALPNPGSGNKLREDLAIWALSNQTMIENRNRAPSNLKSQDDILKQAREQYPAGSAARQQLLDKARALNPNFNGSF